MKTIEQLSKVVKAVTLTKAGKRVYPVTFKQDLINYHYKTGMGIYEISKILDIPTSMAYNWKKLFGKDATGYVHGTRVRYDVRTKCLAIQDELDHGLSLTEIATKYKITRQQYNSWKTIFGDRYLEHISSMTDGVPYIVKTKKHVYGSKNIDIVQEVMNDQVKEYEITITCLQKHGMGSKEVAELQLKLEARKLILEDM